MPDSSKIKFKLIFWASFSQVITGASLGDLPVDGSARKSTRFIHSTFLDLFGLICIMAATFIFCTRRLRRFKVVGSLEVNE